MPATRCTPRLAPLHPRAGAGGGRGPVEDVAGGGLGLAVDRRRWWTGAGQIAVALRLGAVRRRQLATGSAAREISSGSSVARSSLGRRAVRSLTDSATTSVLKRRSPSLPV